MSIYDLRCDSDGCGKEKIIERTSDVEGLNYHKKAAGKAVKIYLSRGNREAYSDKYLLCIECYNDLKSLFAGKKSDGGTCTLCGCEKGFNYLFRIHNMFPENLRKERWTFCEECKYKILPRLGENPYNLQTIGAEKKEKPLTDDSCRYLIG